MYSIIYSPLLSVACKFARAESSVEHKRVETAVTKTTEQSTLCVVRGGGGVNVQLFETPSC